MADQTYQPQLPVVQNGQDPNAAPSTYVPPTNPNTATNMDPSAISALIEQNAKQTGDWGAAESNSIYSKYSPATDSTINALREAQAAQIKELFAHDSHLAATYAPVNTSPGYVQDPNHPVWTPENGQGIIDPMIGSMAATDQQVNQGNDVANMGKQIGQRKDELTNSRDAALNALTLALSLKKMQQDALTTKLTTSLAKQQTLLQMLGLTGGTVPGDISSYLGTAPGAYIPSELQKALTLEKAKYSYDPANQLLDTNSLNSLGSIPGMASLIPGIAGVNNPVEQKLLLNSALGAAFTPRVTTVKTGSDLANAPFGLGSLLQFFGVKPPTTTEQTTIPAFSGTGGSDTGASNPGAETYIPFKKPDGTTKYVPSSHKQDAINMGWQPTQ